MTAPEADAQAQVLDLLGKKIDLLWVLVTAALVFFMQTGFLCVEVGSVRRKNMALTAMKNVVDWVVVSVLYYVVGFGLMFGRSGGGFIGIDSFLDGFVNAPDGSHLSWGFFLFQLAFAGTSATIVSGAMAERTSFKAYLIFSAIVGALIYPVFGHWAWGNGYYSGNKPWLADLGYIDFAGSSVVHMAGGAASFAGIRIVGPRLGRYSSDGRVNQLVPANLSWMGMGVLILWLGWWGFNGGSTLALNDNVAKIIFNTNCAGATGGIAAYLHCLFAQKSEGIQEKFLGGILGGLVAITANCHIVSPFSALIIGVLAGIVHNVSYDLVIRKLRIDDVVGAIPVHYCCGALGILCVAVFGNAAELPHGRLHQLGVQFVGVAACTLWSWLISFASWKLLDRAIGARVSAATELRGLGVAEATHANEFAPHPAE